MPRWAHRGESATDNIILEFWLGGHFMGDDFTAAEKQTIRVQVRGTAAVEPDLGALQIAMWGGQFCPQPTFQVGWTR
jgi:hypothetical protein